MRSPPSTRHVPGQVPIGHCPHHPRPLRPLFVVTLLAHPHFSHATLPLQQTAWYTKSLPTFADALALVRRRLWASLLFQTSPLTPDREKIPTSLFDHLCSLLCYAA